MGATIIVNGRTVVHKDSGGKAPSVPDFCKTPTPPGPPVPIPYVNVAQSSDTADGSKKVKMDVNPIMLKTSKFSTSKGDEAGTAKGVASSTTSGIAKFVNYSFDVKVEGKNVPRLGDPMTNNGNMANSMNPNEVQEIKAAKKQADKEASKIGGELVKKYKKEGVGKEAGRSSGHGKPHKKAGAELIRMANRLAKNNPLIEALKKEGKRLINLGNSISH